MILAKSPSDTIQPMFVQLIEKLKSCHTVGVLSHIRPDGDCIGSQIGFCSWLEANGIMAHAFNADPVPMNLMWLTEEIPIVEPTVELMSQCDALVVLDGNSPARFGDAFEYYIHKYNPPRYMIDHHPEPQSHGFDLVISDDTASSTCELVFQMYAQGDIEQLDEMAAKALYTGLITDTGSLQYDSVTPDTMMVASELLKRGGFRPNEVAERVFANRSLNQLRLLGDALQTIELYENNQIATMYVTTEMLEKTNTTNDDCEGFVSYPLSISGIKAAVLFKDMGKGVKMSLRSKSEVDVNKWARELDGGGHKKASGAWHPGPLEHAIADVIKIGARQLLSLEKT